MKLPDKLHVPDPEADRHYPFDYSVFYDDPERADRYDFVFTVSPVPDRAGWETDSGTEGYGIPRKLAEEIAFRYNDFPAMLRVVEAAREAIAAFDAANEVKYDENKWDRLVGSGSHERIREALADYDKSGS